MGHFKSPRAYRNGEQNVPHIPDFAINHRLFSHRHVSSRHPGHLHGLTHTGAQPAWFRTQRSACRSHQISHNRRTLYKNPDPAGSASLGRHCLLSVPQAPLHRPFPDTTEKSGSLSPNSSASFGITPQTFPSESAGAGPALGRVDAHSGSHSYK